MQVLMEAGPGPEAGLPALPAGPAPSCWPRPVLLRGKTTECR